MTMTHRPITRGDLISTLCFAGMALWLAGTATQVETPRAILLGLCALACLAAALRHPLARIMARHNDTE
jgi:hypothetical protein